MNQKTAIALAVVAAVIVIGGAALSGGGSNGEETKSSSSLVADRESHDFGTIDIFGGKVETDFTFTNTGAEEVVVLAGTTSCGCTEGRFDGVGFGMHEQMAGTVVVGAGESKTLTAIYDPLAHGPDATGPITRQLFLKTNSTETPEIEVRISALVVKNEQ